MKHTLYICFFAVLTLGACSGEQSKPFSEEETQQQDSIDQINQEDAFNELLDESDSTETENLNP